MKKVLLIFPDIISLTEFIFKQKPSNAEVNSGERSLLAVLTDKQIAIACERHGAVLKQTIMAF